MVHHRTAVVMYLPVLHQGYLNFFEKFRDKFCELFILGRSITSQERSFQKDIRALNPHLIAKIVDNFNIFTQVNVLEKNSVTSLNNFKFYDEIIMPNDTVSRELKPKLEEDGLNVVLEDFFLRWDSDNAIAHLDVNCPTIEADKFLEEKLKQVIAEGHKTSDIYREVGGMIFNRETGECLIGHNSAFPDENIPYYEGDPRSLFKKGIFVELSTALHAEAKLISEAARIGFCTNEAEIIVTDFPCPPCAKLVANSGIKKLYFLNGYAMLDGERVLLEAGVSIFKIEMPQS